MSGVPLVIGLGRDTGKALHRVAVQCESLHLDPAIRWITSGQDAENEIGWDPSYCFDLSDPIDPAGEYWWSADPEWATREWLTRPGVTPYADSPGTWVEQAASDHFGSQAWRRFWERIPWKEISEIHVCFVLEDSAAWTLPLLLARVQGKSPDTVKHLHVILPSTRGMLLDRRVRFWRAASAWTRIRKSNVLRDPLTSGWLLDQQGEGFDAMAMRLASGICGLVDLRESRLDDEVTLAQPAPSAFGTYAIESEKALDVNSAERVLRSWLPPHRWDELQGLRIEWNHHQTELALSWGLREIDFDLWYPADLPDQLGMLCQG